LKVLFINAKKKFLGAGNSSFNLILKRNQIVLFAVALMLITAGYMNYNNINNMNISMADLGDAQLVSGDLTSDDIVNEEAQASTTKNMANVEAQVSTIENTTNEKIQATTTENVANEEVQASTTPNVTSNIVENQNTVINTEVNTKDNSPNYFLQTKLERSSMYSQMLETYQKILENEKIPSDQKSIAANEIKNINDRQNAIQIIENLLKNKDFENSIILVNDNNIDVIIKSNSELTTEQVAQIEDIVARELKAEIQDIHISIHK